MNLPPILKMSSFIKHSHFFTRAFHSLFADATLSKKVFLLQMILINFLHSLVAFAMLAFVFLLFGYLLYDAVYRGGKSF